MVRQTVRAVIDQHEYEINQLPPLKALQVFTKLLKIFGGSLGKALKGSKVDFSSISKNLDSNGLDSDIGSFSGFFGEAIETICDKLNEQELEQMIKSVFETVSLVSNGKTMSINSLFESHFQGETYHMFKLFFKALEVNFSDFFSGLRTLFNTKIAGFLQTTEAKTD